MQQQIAARNLGRWVLLVVGALLVALVVTMSFGGAALAQDDPYEDDTPTVEDTLFGQDNPESDTGATLETRDSGGALPFTGADITLFVATGLAAIGTGAVIVRRSRVKKSES